MIHILLQDINGLLAEDAKKSAATLKKLKQALKKSKDKGIIISGGWEESLSTQQLIALSQCFASISTEKGMLREFTVSRCSLSWAQMTSLTSCLPDSLKSLGLEHCELKEATPEEVHSFGINLKRFDQLEDFTLIYIPSAWDARQGDIVLSYLNQKMEFMNVGPSEIIGESARPFTQKKTTGKPWLQKFGEWFQQKSKESNLPSKSTSNVFLNDFPLQIERENEARQAQRASQLLQGPNIEALVSTPQI